MPTDNPMRVQEIADRLARYYEDDDILEIRAHSVPRHGFYIRVSRSDEASAALMLTAHQVDNGANGFRDTALARINAFRDGAPYVEPAPAGRVYDDVMTYS